MTWLFHRWLAYFGVSLFVFKDCRSLFLRNKQTGECIAASETLVYTDPYALPYFVKMTENCLDKDAQFRYLQSDILHNIAKNGTLLSSPNNEYENQWAVYIGNSTGGRNHQKSEQHCLKQTAAGRLSFYNKDDACAKPSAKVIVTSTCTGENTPLLQFTFGSVTSYNARMKYTHCSSTQLMRVQSAQYADFNNPGTFNQDTKRTETECSRLTNCQLKYLCGGKQSCELTLDNNVLPSEYCSNTSKQIYTKYTCVDEYIKPPIKKAPKIRLTNRNTGYIEIKDIHSKWRKVNETNWDEKRQKMLCQYLGFEAIQGKVEVKSESTNKEQIFNGDLMCYSTQRNETSCCINLKYGPVSDRTYVKCKMCDNPLLYNTSTFPDSVFSGGGDLSNKYENARITKRGWCPSRSDSAFLLIDLQKEYHITQVVVMADEEQTKWSSSYSLKYSHDTSYKYTVQISGNRFGYQASRTKLHIYNVRHVKIQSTGNTTFCLRIELCGRDGSQNEGGFIFKNLPVAASATAAAVFIIIALVLAFLYLRRRKRNKKQEDSETGSGGEDKTEDDDEEMETEFESKQSEDDFSNEQGDPNFNGHNKDFYSNERDDVQGKAHQPVPIAEFSHYVKELRVNDNCAFLKQYDDLPKNVEKSWEVAKKPFNKEKNRYGNIVTFDYCRVVLSGKEGEDYINASYIDGIRENSYIASQGPKKHTVKDMWRMIWEQHCYSIVMVTSLVEVGKPKCEKYWPDRGTEKYGDIGVTLVKVEEFACHVAHTLKLNKGGEEREVKHYHFRSWPDHGVPEDPTQILTFRRHFRTQHVEQSGPVLVHCSAGVGRTGVFLAIDMILDKLEKGVINSIDVFGEVCAMRERRMNMVQTLEQYIFIHKAILETIVCGMNEVDSSNIREEMKRLAETKARGKTGFQEKFQTLGEVSPKLSPEECTAALLEGNISKNRDKNIYPAERNRVSLRYVDGETNSDYINAVYVNGYLGRNYFIATQIPLPETINDFWRLVHSQKSSAIVLLSNVDERTSYPIFWPTNRGEPTQYGSLTVQLDSEKESNGIWRRKFILAPYADLSGGQVVNIFHYTKWPNHRVPLDADDVITLTSQVENSKKNHGHSPIIVVCSDGAGRTGTYIAISNLLERVKVEQAIDVFQSIKIIRAARPQFVENAEQYQFCYTAVAAYLDAFSDYANFE